MTQPGSSAEYGYEPVAQIGLRHYLTRFLHITVNVRDLERTTRLYEEVMNLKRTRRLNGPAQRFAGLGIEEGRFEGWELRDTSEFPARAVHVVEWKSPKPVGTAYEQANHVGFYRFLTLMRETGLRGAYERALKLGGEPYGEIGMVVLDKRGIEEGPLFTFRDPDGISVEVANDPTPPDGRDRLYHVEVNCRDLATSYSFYRDVVGLDLFERLDPDPQPNNPILGNLLSNPDGSRYTGGTCEFDAAMMKLRADYRNPLDLLQWQSPPTYGSCYESPVNVGIQSLAFEVDNMDLAYAALQRALSRHPGQIAGPPEDWDLGEGGRYRVLNFFDPDGARLQLYQSLDIPNLAGDRNIEPLTPLA